MARRDKGFPDTGIIAEGRFDTPGWVSAKIDLSAIREVRRDGHVLNKAHWDEQAGRDGPVRVERLISTPKARAAGVGPSSSRAGA